MSREVSIHASARDATPETLFNAIENYVSIHASARDATVPPSCARRICKVSIHASARDATASSAEGVRQSPGFNPRVRAGRDGYYFKDVPTVNVSIHASARDATDGVRFLVGLVKVSIHASARDATCAKWRGIVSSQFQSTRPRGTRLCNTCLHFDAYEFQSTRPRGTRRARLRLLDRTALVSIHASARDATLKPYNLGLKTEFQSTRPRGTRPLSCSIQCKRKCFNPRVRAGRDTRQAQQPRWMRRFNPRVRAGRDRPTSNACQDSQFQSTRPRGTRQDPPFRLLCRTTVSIHASARDATRAKGLY